MTWSQVLLLALLWFLATFPVAVIVGRVISTPDYPPGDRSAEHRSPSKIIETPDDDERGDAAPRTDGDTR